MSLLWICSAAAQEDYSAQVRSEILPWVESVGQLFGFTQEGLDSLNWDEAYLSSCSKEQFQRLQAVTTNPAFCYCPTGYYRMATPQNAYMYLEGSNPQTATGSTYAVGLSTIVKIERTADGGCYLQMQGFYLHTPQRNQALKVSVVPEKFFPVPKTPGGQVAFTTMKGTYSVLSAASNSVMGATLNDAASYWNVTPASDMLIVSSVSNEGTYYHTLFAPFAVAPQEGVQAFTVEEHEGKVVATGELATVPAFTPVFLRGNKRTMGFEIADKTPSAPEPNLVLRNEKADLSYYYFNKAFLLYSGDSQNNNTYYRSNMGTKDKLYFWRQALVILMVEDRYDFRGDRSTASLIIDLLDAFSAQEGGNGNSAEARDARQRGLSDWTWNDYNDDLLWAGLAYVRGYLITGEQRFLEQAKWAWDFMYNRGWDSELGGGIWWSVEKNEKSGLSNNPAVCMASYLYDATGDPDYLTKARAIYAWVRSRLRNSDGSVDEHIKANGTRPNAYNVYNQGTFIEGAAALARITGSNTYRSDARKTIEYVMVHHVDSRGLMSRRKTDEGTWQSEFARGIAFYLKAFPSDWTYRGRYTSSQVSITYYDWMRRNADAAWETRDLVNNLSDCEWDKQTPVYPSTGNTWSADLVCSSVIMLNVTPEVKPGSEDEVYVDIDDRSAEFAYVPEPEPEPEVPMDTTFEVDQEGIMRVNTPIKIACVGNSITEGYGNSSQRMAWPGQLERLLGGSYAVGNYGKSGYCLGKKTDWSFWNTDNFTNAKAMNPDILIMALGTNDADPWRWDQWGGEFKQDYLDMLTEFRANGRNPILFCALAPPIFPTATSRQNNYIETKLIPIVREIAAEQNAYIIDFHNTMLNNASGFPDNVHPNDAGAALMAKVAYDCIMAAQSLQGSVTVDGANVEGTSAIVSVGGSVTLIPVSGREGTWSWTGPSNFKSTERIVELSNVRTGGTYTVQFTDGDGHRSVINFLVSLKGQKAGTITPYVKTSEGDWQSVTELTVRPGQTLHFGPQCSTANLTWAWYGPTGFLGFGREMTVTGMNKAKAGVYGVTVTDAQGRQSTLLFTIRVDGELSCEPLIPYVSTGSWSQTTNLSVAAGGSVTFGPQPTDGEWTWFGPNGFKYSGREARVSNFDASKAGEYVATRTTDAGCYDQLIFTITLK